MKIGMTGPSSFTWDVADMIYDAFKSEIVPLYGKWRGRLDECGAVVVAGGQDMHPSWYDKSIRPKVRFKDIDIDRDKRELEIVQHCLDKGMPMLCICRGMQVLGIHLDMEFVSDIPLKPVNHSPEKHSKQSFWPGTSAHTVSFDPKYDSIIYDFGFTDSKGNLLKTVNTNSFHHQGLRAPSKTGSLVGYTEDGIVELMTGHNWIATQWHPEYDWWKMFSSNRVVEKFKQVLHGFD